MKKALGVMFAVAWGVGLTACLAGDPEEVEDGDEEAEEEEVGSVQQEVGVGGACGPGIGTCNLLPNPLTCCHNILLQGNCRNLQNDEANCGSCGNDCYEFGPPPPPWDGEWHCISGQCIPS